MRADAVFSSVNVSRMHLFFIEAVNGCSNPSFVPTPQLSDYRNLQVSKSWVIIYGNAENCLIFRLNPAALDVV